MKVLIAEDDEHTREGLRELLEMEGYGVVCAAGGVEALQLAQAERPDLLLLDIMMPGLNGYDVCREIRRQEQKVPVIFVSAKSEEIDKVLGLELGADDFITKPFGVREVMARIRAVTRRTYAARRTEGDAANEPFAMGELNVYPAELRARREGQVIELSLLDVRILRLLCREAGRVVTRDMFFDKCWGLGQAPNSRTLDQHVSKLRKRIERDPRRPRIIRTVHGAGYRYDPDRAPAD